VSVAATNHPAGLACVVVVSMLKHVYGNSGGGFVVYFYISIPISYKQQNAK
jgi:hypothetical protein